MKLSCRREELLGAVQIAGQSVPKRHVNDALDNRFLLSAKKAVSVSATDYNIYVEFSLGADAVDIEEGGEVLLPLDKVVQLLRESRDEWIVLERGEGTRCRVGFSDGYFELLIGDAEEFPASPRKEQGAEFGISRDLLIEAMDKGRVARAPEEGRFLFDHCLLESRDERFVIASTDGRRMALFQGRVETRAASPIRVLLSQAVMQQVRKLCDRTSGDVRITVGRGKVFFETDRGRVMANTRDEASFPDYRPHMEKKRTRSVVLQRTALLSATKRIALLTNEQERAVEFCLKPGEMVLRCQSGSSGSGEIRLEAQYEGASETLHFDPAYLSESLAAMGEDTVAMRFENAREGAVLEEADRFKYLVMPIILDSGESG